MKMKIYLYTAIFGNYETLKNPIKIEGLDYVCFTDNKELKSDLWDIRYIDLPSGVPPPMFYKKIKCLSHYYLEEYDITIWLDANFVVKNITYLEYLLSNFKTNKLMLYKHTCLARLPRDCAYTEAKYSMTIHKYSKEKLNEQLIEYENIHKFPKNFGLYQSGFLMRNNKDNDVINFNQKWLDQIERFGTISPQCQVSLPFILWKTNINFDTLENIWDTQMYDISQHGSNYKFIEAYINT
jgi:hypothetical protein